MKRLLLIALLLITMPYIYGGCSGGGGGGSGPAPVDKGTAPTITDMKFFWINDGVPVETLTFWRGDKWNVNIFANDPDLDMDTFYVEEFLAPDFTTPANTATMLLPSQADENMVYFLIESQTIGSPAGDWRECVWIVDSKGNESNTFCVNIVIVEPLGLESPGLGSPDSCVGCSEGLNFKGFDGEPDGN